MAWIRSLLPRRQFQSHRRDYQIIFQDPNAALNPRMTILSPCWSRWNWRVREAKPSA
jgi:ABC-type glutathione transport system ATPase component